LNTQQTDGDNDEFDSACKVLNHLDQMESYEVPKSQHKSADASLSASHVALNASSESPRDNRAEQVKAEGLMLLQQLQKNLDLKK